MFDVLALER